MKQLVTRAIILTRTDYGEADRILTVLTPDHGKLRLLAKGVRRVKSKLAGGIELFSVSTITFVQGRSELGTLVSTRLNTHYGAIVEDLDRTMTGYDLIKQLHKATEDQADEEYFDLLWRSFEALNDPIVDGALIRYWFTAQLLQLGGHTPNLETDAAGTKLQPGRTYDFDYDHMCFVDPGPHDGQFGTDHIKFLRVTFAGHSPKALQSVQGSERLLQLCGPLVQRLMHIRPN